MLVVAKEGQDRKEAKVRKSLPQTNERVVGCTVHDGTMYVLQDSRADDDASSTVSYYSSFGFHVSQRRNATK